MIHYISAIFDTIPRSIYDSRPAVLEYPSIHSDQGIAVDQDFASACLKILRSAEKPGTRQKDDAKYLESNCRELARSIVSSIGSAQADNAANIEAFSRRLVGCHVDEGTEGGIYRPIGVANLYYNSTGKLPEVITDADIKDVIDRIINNFVCNLRLVIERTRKNEGAIKKKFNIPNDARFMSCEIAPEGDPHNGSQQVCIITYGYPNGGGTGWKVCYKPRNMDAEACIAGSEDSLFSKINPFLESKGKDVRLGTLRYLPCGDFGYVEFIDYDGFRKASQEDGKQYARNLGALEYMCFYACISDVTAQNVIAKANIPFLIDLESCWDPRVATGIQQIGIAISVSKMTNGTTDVSEGYKKLSTEVQEECRKIGYQTVLEILEGNEELRRFAIEIQKRGWMRYIPMYTGGLKSLISTRRTHEAFVDDPRVGLIAALRVKIARDRQLLGQTGTFEFENGEKLRQALIEDRKNLDIPLLLRDAEGFIYIRDIRIGRLYDNPQFWEKALMNVRRPLTLGELA